MSVPSNAEIQQIADRLVGTACRDYSLPRKTPQTWVTSRSRR